MNTYNIVFFIILIIIFVHHIVGNVTGSFFTSNEIINYNCTEASNDKGKRYNICNNYYNSITTFLNYAIININTKELKTSITADYDNNNKNPLTSILPLSIMSMLILLIAIILLFIYIFNKNIYIKSFIYISFGLCLLFTCIIIILVPTVIMDKVKKTNCSIQLMYDNKYDSETCVNTLNYGYLTNVITSFLIICILFYLYKYGFKTL